MSSLHDHNFKDLPTDWRHDGPLSARNDEKHMPAVTPPTVHDSDRKALKEIEQSCLTLEGAPGYESPFLDIEAAALIIARHHAEERAAVEKVLKTLQFLIEIVAAHEIESVQCDGKEDEHCDCLRKQVASSRAALTALRTASQSPTEEKT